jgi:hypothetical protein
MAKGTKGVGGGVNSMHLSNTSHPFGTAAGMKGSSKHAKMAALSANPGGTGDKISANAARGPVKGGINGPGVAK